MAATMIAIRLEVGEARLARVFELYGGLLRRYLLGLARRPEVAEDLAQQVWLKLLEAQRTGRNLPADDAGLRSYAFTVARNLFLDECVRKHASARTSTHDPRVLEGLVGVDSGCAAEDDIDLERLRERIRAELRALSEPQQDTLRLWMNGTSIESMASELQAPRDTVLSRKKYAFKRLRTALADLAPATAH